MERSFTTDARRAAKGVAAALLTGALLVTAVAQAQSSSPTVAPPGGTIPAAKGAAPKAGAKTGAVSADQQQKNDASYAIGVSVGSELRRSKISASDVSTEKIAAGMRDALSGKAQMSPEYQQTIMGLLKKAHEADVAERGKEAEPNHAKAAAFLAENAKKKDIVTTASGLQYKVINAGTGAAPKPGDMVTVNYKGTLLDGTEFDSSAKHGGPATFPSNQVIPGWQEALQLMKPGAKFQLFIPPKLAYDVESPPTIPPGSMLIFDVELVSVKPAPTAPAGAGPGAPGAGSRPQTPPPPK